jgi:cell division septation protein DedD
MSSRSVASEGASGTGRLAAISPAPQSNIRLSALVVAGTVGFVSLNGAILYYMPQILGAAPTPIPLKGFITEAQGPRPLIGPLPPTAQLSPPAASEPQLPAPSARVAAVSPAVSSPSAAPAPVLPRPAERQGADAAHPANGALALKGLAAPSAAPPAVAALAQPKPSDGLLVQIGALPSQALALQTWDTASSKLPEPLDRKNLRVQPIQKDGKTLYRALIAGFSSRDDAAALCATLKEKGVACFIRPGS